MAIDEIGDGRRRQDRAPVDDDDVKPDAEAGKPLRPLDGIGGRGLADHQAGAGENSVPVRPFDRLVDRGVEPEIVGADDQSLQLAALRSRRNWKNSTPSRRRRTSICRSRAISPTIEAIFPARK